MKDLLKFRLLTGPYLPRFIQEKLDVLFTCQITWWRDVVMAFGYDNRLNL
jgi:hypothetical protein